MGRGLLIHQVSRLHTKTPQSVRLLWMSDQPATETSTLQHTQNSQQTDRQTDRRVSSWIRTRNPSKRTASYPLHRSRGHLDRLILTLIALFETLYSFNWTDRQTDYIAEGYFLIITHLVDKNGSFCTWPHAVVYSAVTIALKKTRHVGRPS